MISGKGAMGLGLWFTETAMKQSRMIMKPTLPGRPCQLGLGLMTLPLWGIWMINPML